MKSYNFEMDNITEIPDELLCVGWSDGDINHLKSLVKEDTREQCLQGKNIKCKQSAKRTGVEQPADVSVIFKLLKQTERTTTLDDIINDTLSPMLDKIFKDLYKANELNLQPFKLVVLKLVLRPLRCFGRYCKGCLNKAFQAFERHLKGLYRALKQAFKKAFQKPFHGVLKAF